MYSEQRTLREHRRVRVGVHGTFCRMDWNAFHHFMYTFQGHEDSIVSVATNQAWSAIDSFGPFALAVEASTDSIDRSSTQQYHEASTPRKTIEGDYTTIHVVE